MNNDTIIKTIMNLADDMAAAATSFNSHGYDNFIQSRERFQDHVKSLIEEVLSKKMTEVV